MGCHCNGILPQSQESYQQMITVNIPLHMSSYLNERTRQGLSNQISIDPCIFDEILFLWQNEIITLGSCCGHNLSDPIVIVSDESIFKMIKLDYFRFDSINDPNIFKLKSFNLFT